MIQLTLFDHIATPPFQKSEAVADALESLSSGNNTDALGAIFTRIEVVEFILNLVGYVEDKPLHLQRILEPSFGNGEFILPIVDRLLKAWRKHGGNNLNAYAELNKAIIGVELHRETFNTTRNAVINRVKQDGLPDSLALALVNRWLIQGDFLFEQREFCFDFVVGNPPYVRQELIPAPLLSEYRRLYQTMYDRADLYIPFIEHSLSLLKEGGNLGFICADRWTKNRYGGPLREFISKSFHLKAFVDMGNTNAFHSEVNAYPAITVISKSKQGATRIAHRPKINKKTLAFVATDIKSDSLPKGSSVLEMSSVVSGSEPWILESPNKLKLIRRIESNFPKIEQAACKVGIGVATGADNAFIGSFESLDVELDRKLPLVATGDIKSGEVIWQGQGVINPFTESGKLVDLQDYPKLARYLDERRGVIAKRYCAKKAPSRWYRTIDRICPELTSKPKLLIPDIKSEAHIVFEEGKFYPHHNLYYIVSDVWDLRALQAIMLSSIAKMFVSTYSTKMRGGYLRFQAQYLRRICVPFWHDISENLRQELICAAHTRNIDTCNKAVFKLYKLNEEEQSVFNRNGE